MRRVILESPYAGNATMMPNFRSYNIRYAQKCVRDCLLRGEAPIASHLLYTQDGILNDSILSERKLGIDAGHEWIGVAEAMVVYEDLGISSGMKIGIRLAQKYNIPIEYRTCR